MIMLTELLRKAAGKKRETENSELLREIGEVLDRIRAAGERFDYAVAEDSIDASVYELQALNARYRSLLSEAKRTGARGVIARPPRHTADTAASAR